MIKNLYYILTVLPSLPPLGQPLAPEDPIARLKEEMGEGLLYLADLLDCEEKIGHCIDQYYLAQNEAFIPEFSHRIPADFVETFMTYGQLEEQKWLEKAYLAWYSALYESGKKVKSSLISLWARWEFGLRMAISRDRNKRLGLDLPNLPPDYSLAKLPEEDDFSFIVQDYHALAQEPQRAEQLLDNIRLEYLQSLSNPYSFDVDELISYILRYRIHKQYAKISLERGRTILEEVTKL